MIRDDVVKLAREASTTDFCYFPQTDAELERFASLIASAEREACSKVAEDFLTQGRSPLGRSVAATIRART